MQKTADQIGVGDHIHVGDITRTAVAVHVNTNQYPPRVIVDWHDGLRSNYYRDAAVTVVADPSTR